MSLQIINQHKNNYKTILLAAFVINGLISLAQPSQGVIHGSVFTPENEPAVYSTVVLMNKDSVFMNGTLVAEDGLFSFNNLNAGDYHIMVRNIEYSTHVSDLLSIGEKKEIELNKIQLRTNVNDLSEVVIKGEKAMVEVHPDKMVYNISASVNSTGNNALELLAKSPGVRVDMDNNIILQGKKGVQVYINGRPSRISGSDLANMLEGMQSEDIESIELITNPSSKYDAEGSGGVINIVMKKDLNSGLNGNVKAGYSKGEKPRSNVGTSINYSSKKVNLFSSLNYSDNNYTFNLNEIMRREAYALEMASLGPTHRQGINFTGGMDYKINREHTLSFDAKALLNDRKSPSSSNTFIEDLNDVTNSERLIAKTLDDGNSANYNANLHYSFVPNRSTKFTADVSYGNYVNSKFTDQPNEYYSIDSVLLRTVQSQYDANTGIDLFSGQIDYEKSFGKSSFSSGAKYSYINTNNVLDFYDIENSTPVFNDDRSNNFTYLEKVAAAYAILNWKPSDKISVNAGLRVENTSSLGELISSTPGPDDVVRRDYTDLFPNVSISYDNKKSQALSLGYSRRITRPNYQNLNPFESKVNEISSWKGNPFLEPNYIDNYQLSYSFKRKLVISNTYSIINNYFANVFITNDDKGKILSPRNLDKSIVNGLSLSYPLKVAKWYEFSTFFLYNYEAYSGNIEGSIIDVEAHVLNLRIQNNLKLPKDFRLEITAFASSQSVWRGTINIKEYYRINAGLKRTFIDNKLLLQLSASDIFNTGSVYYYSSNYGGMIIDGDAFFDGRRVSFNATYKFGNQNVKSRRSKSSLDKELRRISD